MGAKDDKSEPGPGGVQHDARGNAVWQWAVDSGKQALDSTSRLLKRLEVPGLKLEGDTSERKGPGAAPAPAARGAAQSKSAPSGSAASKPDRQTGYNPYGGAAGARPGTTGARSGAGTKSGVATKPAARTTTRPSFWRACFDGIERVDVVDTGVGEPVSGG
jgi:hypothetical protein